MNRILSNGFNVHILSEERGKVILSLNRDDFYKLFNIFNESIILSNKQFKKLCYAHGILNKRDENILVIKKDNGKAGIHI